jgi:hypothetical protein
MFIEIILNNEEIRTWVGPHRTLKCVFWRNIADQGIMALKLWKLLSLFTKHSQFYSLCTCDAFMVDPYLRPADGLHRPITYKKQSL